MKSQSLLTLALVASFFGVALHAQDPFFANQAVKLTRDAFVYASSVSDAPIVATGHSGELATVTSAYLAAADIRTNRGPLVWWCNVHFQQRTPSVSGVICTDDGSGQPGLVEVTPTGSFTMTWTPMQIRGDPQTLLTVNVSPSFSHDLYADYQTFVRISGTTDWIPVGGKQAPHFEAGRTYARFIRLPDTITDGATQPVPVDLKTTISYQGNGETIATSEMGGAFVFFPALPLSFATQLTDQLVLSNDPVSMSTSATGGSGSTYTYSWSKNGTSIDVTTPAINIGHAAFDDAGVYDVTVSDGTNTISASAKVVIVDSQSWALSIPKNTSTSLTAASGVGASFVWSRNGTILNDDSRIKGTSTSSLMVSPGTTSIAGVYVLEATLNGKTIRSGNITVSEPTASAPVLLDQTFDRAMTGKPFQHQISASPDAGNPTKYAASGLPSGLTLNSSTGLISGTSKVAGRFNVKLSASNQVGTSPLLTLPLVVESMPSTMLGSWVCSVNIGNAEGAIGGRIDATISATGAVSGKILLGVTSFPFTGLLDLTKIFDTGYADVTIPMRRTSPMPPVSLFLHFDSANEVVDGWLDDDTETLPLTVGGWHCAWNKLHPATIYAGTFTFGTPYAVSVAGDAEYPQGCNYGTVSINAITGTATFSARVADDTFATPIIATCPLGPNGDLCLYAARYLGYSATLKKNTANGCLLGYMSIASDGRGLDGALQWKKGKQLKASRTYPDGFSVQASIIGGRYVPPAKGQRLFGLQSDTETAFLGFSGTSLLDSISDPTIAFSVASTNRVIVPTVASGWNPCSTQLTITAATGYCSGSFKLGDPTPKGRAVAFYGVLVCSATGDQTGYGFFMAPMLPLPGQTILTSPLMSGAVSITP